MSTIQNRYDFILLFDVKDGNPNGDPDGGNLPRVDSETGCGLVTDVCIKRKIRNFIGVVKDEQPPYDIYIKEKAVLNQTHEKAYKAIEEKKDSISSSDEKSKISKKSKNIVESVKKARDWMCKNFYDVRTFGAVMSTGVNCGQVRGPVQLTFGRSIDRIVPQEHSITRMAVTTDKEAERQQGGNRTMGRKFTIPYGLYCSYGFVSAHLAEQTGFDEEDLNLFWKALTQMFEHDRSASRGAMATRGLYIFKHENKLGNVLAHDLFDLIKPKLKENNRSPRSFGDYIVEIEASKLPKEIELIRKIG